MRKFFLDTARPRQASSRLLVIYTGGTLGMMRKGGNGPMVPLDFSELADKVPEIWNLDVDLEILSYDQPLDSSNIGPEEWLGLARTIGEHYESFDGFVILHGTDTMAFSASALSFLLLGLNKPVIFTGAQLPIGFPRTDARGNLTTALQIASTRKDGEPMVREVCIYFNHRLLRANRTSKVESFHFDAFHSENYPALAKAGVEIQFQEPYLWGRTDLPFGYLEKLETGILIQKVVPGCGFNIVNNKITNPKPRGVILETFGSGNIPQIPEFIEMLSMLVDDGIPVLNISQCPGGEVIQGKYQASAILNEIGVLSGKDLTFEAAFTKMMVVLGNYSEPEKRIKLLTSPIVGEMKP